MTDYRGLLCLHHFHSKRWHDCSAVRDRAVAGLHEPDLHFCYLRMHQLEHCTPLHPARDLG